jgi:hypothetical protein
LSWISSATSRTLLATLALNRMAPSGVEAAAFEVVTASTPLQARALRLLNLTAATLL